MEHLRPDILEIILRHLQGAATQPETEQLQVWLGEGPQNRAHFEEISKIWMESGKWESDFSPNLDQAWEKVKSSTLELGKKPSKGEKVVLFPQWFWKVAASVLVLIGFGLVFQLWNKKEENWNQVSSLQEKKLVILPDSTKVWLNRNSILQFADFEGEMRQVKLEGEAFFEVVKNPEKPFQIKGRQSLTEVLGTSFRLISLPSGKDRVEVAAGLVAFSNLKNGYGKVYLKPGKCAEIQADGKLVETIISDPNFVALKTERLVFENTPLPKVCQQLESYFGKPVHIKNEALGQCRFTGSFEKPGLDEVLEVLRFSADLQISTKDSAIFLNGKGCP
jgi:ferric-dicitrate binding protein FerR (iron transport regulator)